MIYSVDNSEIPQIQSILSDVFGEIVENDPFVFYLKYVEKDIIGLLSYSLIYDRIEINYIYVEEKARRKKIASKLLEALEKISDDQKITNISLEVAENNYAAISLYEKMGYEKKAVRHGYYQGIDGILMVKEMIK